MIKITDKFISQNIDKKKILKRGRCNYNFHKKYSEKVQRFFNISNPLSYIRPHKHENPDKREIFIILKGRTVILEFDKKGNVKDYFILDSKKGNFGVEIPPKVWHTFISLERGTTLYEIKEGPYNPKADKSFAPWASAEGTADAANFNKKILNRLKIRPLSHLRGGTGG